MAKKAAAKKKTTRANKEGAPALHPAPSLSLENGTFPVVGIAASAGGFEAFTKLLHALPADTEMAFVLIQHLDPTHESALSSLLSRATRLPVHEVSNGMVLQPNHVYVIPPRANMTLQGSRLSLTRRVSTGRPYMPADEFFASLAAARKYRAIGVVLSGTAHDGTAGLRAIKMEGGITFAQDQGSARYDGMPRSAVAAGVVDFVLNPEEIARELARIGRHPYMKAVPAGREAEILSGGKADISKIFSLLRAHTGSDFSSYKRGTIERRLRRRMTLKRTEDLGSYIKLLQHNREEVTALYEDLLINVTEFFRDEKLFEALSKKVFPELLKDRAADNPIRIWVPGCSTGEEAYSIAMLLIDFLAGKDSQQTVNVFGTDISEIAIGKARAGLYPEGAVMKMPENYLRHFFAKSDHGYRINKRVREVCIFARHDLGKDPPFSHMDLVSCRNVLIYLGQELQNRVIPMFHYALKPNGYLVLGGSETVGPSPLFAMVDKANKIYSKDSGADTPVLNFPAYHPATETKVLASREEAAPEYDLQRESDRVLLARYAPPGVVINEKLDVIQFRGDMSPYLKPQAGPASLNFLKLLREEIVADVQAAVDLARRGTEPVRRARRHIGGEQLRSRTVNIEVIPLATPPERDRMFLVLFESIESTAPAEDGDSLNRAEFERLQEEVNTSRKHLQFLMDERQASDEELRSANEEILSSNEELQSTNEELETSQEELQSANEELTTVNDELQHRNSELSQVGNDLNNLLNSVNVPIIMLGNDLNIRRFTPMAGRLLSLRNGDIGRPIQEVQTHLNAPDLTRLLTEVITDLTPKEIEVRDRAGAWFSLRLRPYRTEDHKIDGAVMVFYDVDQLKRSLDEVRESRDFARAIVETAPGPLVILDSELHVVIGNRAFYDALQLDRRTDGVRRFTDLLRGQWNPAPLEESLRGALLKNRKFQNLEIEGNFDRLGHRTFSVDGRSIDSGVSKRKILLVTITDLTGRKQAEAVMQNQRSRLEKNLLESRTELDTLAARLISLQEEERRRVSRELHDDLNQKLAMLEVDAESLGKEVENSPEIVAKLRSLRGRAADVSNDIRRVAYQLHPTILEHLGLGVALRSYCSEFASRELIEVHFSAEKAPVSIPEDVALCFYRVVQESLRNVVKHSSAKKVTVKLELLNRRVHLAIVDNGIGFDPATSRPGGIGLLSMKERVRLIDGEIMLKSKTGQGTKIDIWAPLPKKKP